MRTPTLPSRLYAFDDLSAQDVQALLAGASIAATGASAALGNQHVAVLCEEPACESAHVLAAAASALGATVVRLRTSSLHLSDRPQVRETARMLGRLYHLIGCEGLGSRVRAGLGRWAGVPVLSDVAATSHPTRILADLMLMQECASRPAAQITLGLFDDTEAVALGAWHQAAGLTGLRIVNLGQQSGDDGRPPCDFYFGHEPAGATQLPRHLVAVGSATGRSESLADRQRDAHRRLLQSLLTNLGG